MVEQNESKLSFQINLWAILGPFFSILSLLILYTKMTRGSILLPLTLLIGVMICWKWKIFGAAIAISLLLITMIFIYSSLPLEERLWHIGIALAIALAFIITALSFSEVNGMISALQNESGSRLENILMLDSKHKLAQEELYKKQIELEDLQRKLKTYQKLVDQLTDQIKHSK